MESPFLSQRISE